MRKIREKSKLKFFVIIYTFIFCINLSGDIFYKISGKVVHNGKGIGGIELGIYKLDSENDLNQKYTLKNDNDTLSDSNGDFHFYVKSGLYKIRYGRSAQNGYVANSDNKIIQVNKENVLNIIFFLSKECMISGGVKFEDGTPVNGGGVDYENNNGVWHGTINNNGEYIIAGIKNGENGDLYFTPNGILQKDIYDVVLNEEGSTLRNVDLILPKKKSIIGTVVDIKNQNKIKRFTIFLQNLSNYEQIRYRGNENNINGEFTFYNLKTGYYALGCDRVFIQKNDGVIIYKRKEFMINLKDNETKEIVIELERESEERVKEIVGAK